MKNKCLVIGGNGFIGKNIVLELLKSQYSVVVFDIVTNNIKEAVFEHDNIHFIEGDINNTSYLTEQLNDIDSVVWLIHTTVPATSMYDVEFDLLSNIPPLLRFMQYMFYVVGEGSKRSTLINELNAIENVIIYDKIYNLSQYLSAFDFIFMPSNFEGLPLFSVEASFQKVPVIINNCPGLNETLPLDWPLKVENNSVDGYLNIFNNIIPNLDKTELGVVAFNFVKDRFSIKTMQNQYEKIYENITIQN